MHPPCPVFVLDLVDGTGILDVVSDLVAGPINPNDVGMSPHNNMTPIGLSCRGSASISMSRDFKPDLRFD